MAKTSGLLRTGMWVSGQVEQSVSHFIPIRQAKVAEMFSQKTFYRKKIRSVCCPDPEQPFLDLQLYFLQGNYFHGGRAFYQFDKTIHGYIGKDGNRQSRLRPGDFNRLDCSGISKPHFLS